MRESFFADSTSFPTTINTRRNGIFMHNFLFSYGTVIDLKSDETFALSVLSRYFFFFPFQDSNSRRRALTRNRLTIAVCQLCRIYNRFQWNLMKCWFDAYCTSRNGAFFCEICYSKFIMSYWRRKLEKCKTTSSVMCWLERMAAALRRGSHSATGVPSNRALR